MIGSDLVEVTGSDLQHSFGVDDEGVRNTIISEIAKVQEISRPVASNKRKRRVSAKPPVVSDLEDDDSDSSAPKPKKSKKKALSPADEIHQLRARVKELEKENKELKLQLKRVCNEKGIKLKSAKTYWKKWGKRILAVGKKKSNKAFSLRREVVVEDVISKEEHDMLFKGKGELIQPRPDNKPKSTVTITDFNTWEQIKELFGEGNIKKDLVVALWRISRPGSFSKSFYMGPGDAEVSSLSVQYNKSKKKIQLKFACKRSGEECFGMNFGSYSIHIPFM